MYLSGSYRTCNLDNIVKFNRSPLTSLVPRDRQCRARTIIDIDTLDIVTSDDRVQHGAREDSRSNGKKTVHELFSTASFVDSTPEELACQEHGVGNRLGILKPESLLFSLNWSK